ncbi:unnamed protein product [Haemonchus placei]|uniref:Alpha,alpha-trehalase n=1 Tax=Haemonchus placei TaxID=6290 RepID=A0A0N4WUC5_HAEPC|nr:unnamed protein product [Haemonchus placei]
MYTNDLVWSDEWAKKALDWAKSPEYSENVDPDLVVAGRGLIVNASDKPVWQKILDVLEGQFDEAEAEKEFALRLPKSAAFSGPTAVPDINKCAPLLMVCDLCVAAKTRPLLGVVSHTLNL